MGQTERGHKTTGRFGTRWLAMLLSLAMLVGMMPGLAFGDEGLAGQGNPEIVIEEITEGNLPSEGAEEDAGDDQQQAAITFSGTVKDKATQAGLAGAEITVFAADGTQLGTAKTGDNGAWSLAKTAAAGGYYCTVKLAGYTFSPDKSAQKDLAADAVALAFDAFAGDEVLPNLTFTGTVATAEGGLGGVAVKANSAGGVVAQVTTDTTGAFTFANLPYAADYTFTYELAGYTIDMTSAPAVTKDAINYTVPAVTATLVAPPPAADEGEEQGETPTTPKTAEGTTPVEPVEEDGEETQLPDSENPDEEEAGNEETDNDASDGQEGQQGEEPGETGDDSSQDEGGFFTYADSGDGETMEQQQVLADTSNDVERVSFVQSSYNLNVGQTFNIGIDADISVDILPEDADESTLVYDLTSGSNFVRLTSNSSGNSIEGIAAGIATLRVTAPSGDSSTTQVVVRDASIAQTITYDGPNPIIYYIDEHTYDDDGNHIGDLDPSGKLSVEVDPLGAPVKWTHRSGLTAFKFREDTETGMGIITLNEKMSGTGTVQATAINGNAVGPVITVQVKAGRLVTGLKVDSYTTSVDITNKDEDSIRLVDALNFTAIKQGGLEVEINRPTDYEWSVVTGGAYLSIAADSTMTPIKAGTALVRVQPKANNWEGATRPSVSVSVKVTDDFMLESLSFTADSFEMDIDDNYGDGESLLAILNDLGTASTNLVWSVVSGSTAITTKKVPAGTGDDPKDHNDMLVKPAKLGTAVVQVVDQGRSGKSAKITISVTDSTYVKELTFLPEGKVLQLDLNNPDDRNYDLFDDNNEPYLLVTPDSHKSTFTWSYVEGNSTIAAVTAKGIVTPKKVGKVVLEVTAVKGGKKARVTVEVKDSNLVETLSFSSESADIDLYDTDAKLDLSRMLNIEPVSANKAMKWTVVNNTTVLSVDQEGKVTPKKLGTALVRATAVSGGKMASIVVNVVDKNAPTDFILYDGKAAETIEIAPRPDLKSYEEIDIDYVLIPEGTAKSTITWKSSSTAIATVSNNKIKPIKEGTFTLTGTTHNGLVRSVILTLKDTAKATGIVFDPPSTVELYDEVEGAPVKNIVNLESSVSLTPPKGGDESDLKASYTWKITSGTTYATIDSMGNLSAVKPGTVTVQVTEAYSKLTAKATIIIVDKTSPTWLQIFGGKTSTTLALGTKTNNAYDPVDPSIPNLSVRPAYGDGLHFDPSLWTVTSSSKTVATAELVEVAGGLILNIQPLKAGTTTITVQIKNTTLKATCSVTFVDESIAKKLWFDGLDGMEFELYDGNVVFESWLRHEGLDGVDSDVDLTWTVSPTTVMTLVDTKRKDSETTLKKVGTATVSVTDSRSKLTAKASIKVIDSTQPTGIQIFTGQAGNPLRVPINPDMDKSTATKIVYEPITIDYNLLPNDGSNRNAKVTWTSSSTAVAKFGFTGAQPSDTTIAFTPVKAGNVTITAKTDNGYSNARSLVLVDSSVWPTDEPFAFTRGGVVNGTLTLDVSEGEVDLNDYLSEKPGNLLYDSYTWTSSSSTYVSVVSATGMATPKQAGRTATITVTEKRSGRKATLKIVTVDKTIWPADEEFKFTQDYAQIDNVNDTIDLSDLLVSPPAEVVPKLKWATSASTSVSIDQNGVATAKKGGVEVTITVTEEKSGKKATIKVVTVDATKIAIFGGRSVASIDATPISYNKATNKTTYAPYTGFVETFGNMVEYTEASFLPKKPTNTSTGVAYTALDGGEPTLFINSTGTVSVKVATKAHGSPTSKVTIVDPLMATKLFWNTSGGAIPTTIDLEGDLETTIDLDQYLDCEPGLSIYDRTDLNDVIWRVTSGNATVDQNGVVTLSKLGSVTVEAKDQRNASAYVRATIKVTDSNQITSMVAIPKSSTPYVHDRAEGNETLTLWADDSDLLTIKPENASGSFKWEITTGNKTIGEIDGDGLGSSVSINTIKPGTMNVKVTDIKTGKNATFPVKVIDSKRLTNLGFTYKTENRRVDVANGFEVPLTNVLEAVATAPSGAVLGNVTYKISTGTANAKIEGDQLILLKSTGTFTVQATDDDTGVKGTSLSISITDSRPPTSIAIQHGGSTAPTMDITHSVIADNNIRELIPLLTRTDGTEATRYVTWTSSNPAVVKVLDYNKADEVVEVQSLKTGTATITATTHNGKTATLKITVK